MFLKNHPEIMRTKADMESITLAVLRDVDSKKMLHNFNDADRFQVILNNHLKMLQKGTFQISERIRIEKCLGNNI